MNAWTQSVLPHRTGACFQFRGELHRLLRRIYIDLNLLTVSFVL